MLNFTEKLACNKRVARFGFFTCVLIIAGCVSSPLYIEEVSKGKYLVDIYRLPDRQTAKRRWQEEIIEICKEKILEDNVTITLETEDGPTCEGCGFIKSYKKGTYTAWGTVECQP